MAGGERPQLSKNEGEQQQLKDSQKGDQHTARLQQDGLYGQAITDRSKTADASREVAADGSTTVTPERAQLALQRLNDAMNDPTKAQLLAGLVENSDGAFSRVLLTGLSKSDDPAKQQSQKELLAMIQNAFTDSTRSA